MVFRTWTPFSVNIRLFYKSMNRSWFNGSRFSLPSRPVAAFIPVRPKSPRSEIGGSQDRMPS